MRSIRRAERRLLASVYALCEPPLSTHCSPSLFSTADVQRV